MFILGISSYYHDSAACIIHDGKVVVAAQEERFSRIKNDATFPVTAIKFCLSELGLNLKEIDYIVYYEKPLLKFERIIETHLLNFPKGLKQFCTSMNSWIGDKLLFRKKIHTDLNQIEHLEINEYKLRFSKHHLSHAASAYFTSGFLDAAIVTIDGVGEWATTSIYKAKKSRIELVKEIHFPNSIGLFYSAFTYFCGFKVNSGEYKLMGLAPYGNSSNSDYKKFKEIILSKLVIIHPDGSFTLEQNYFCFSHKNKMIDDSKWENLFGVKKNSKELYPQEYCDLALAAQHVTENLVMGLIKQAKKETESNNLCLSGGVALNCVANSKIKNMRLFENIWLHPAAGDAGGSVGAALAFYFDKHPDALFKKMTDSFLGPKYEESFIEASLIKNNVKYARLDDQSLIPKIAKDISEGNVVGWFEGRMEWGPRALGHRSIIGDPTSEKMQKILNIKIKYRESFRPFAPMVTIEDTEQYFKFSGESPFMLYTAQVSDSIKICNSEDFDGLDQKEKLDIPKSKLPAITHVDLSARLQTVDSKTNKRIHRLLNEFKELTGFSVLINTSFNVRGEPIVCSPDDAINCFFNTQMDILVLENFVIYKSNQVN